MYLNRILFIMLLLFDFQFVISNNLDTLKPSSNDINYSLNSHWRLSLLRDDAAASVFLERSVLRASFENRYFIKELMNEELDAVFRFQQNAFLLSVNHLGCSRYGEMSLSAGYARGFGKHIAIGLRAYYLFSHAMEYPSVHSFTFDASIYAHIGKSFGLGFSVYNPARLRYGVTGTVCLPVRLHFDFDYLVGRNVLLFTKMDLELKTCVTATLGSRFRLRNLFLTCWASFPNAAGCIQVDLACRRFLLGVECTYSYPLGFVPRASVCVAL